MALDMLVTTEIRVALRLWSSFLLEVLTLSFPESSILSDGSLGSMEWIGTALPVPKALAYFLYK
jgi:hypothetical protein